MPRALSPFHVPRDKEAEILQEITVRAEAKKRQTTRAFDPALGSTPEEAEATLRDIRADINRYGEYVYGYTPALVHRYWNQQVSDVIERKIRPNKILLLAPPNSAKSTWNSLIRTTYHLGNHPDEHLLFLTSSDDMARTFSTSVRLILSENARQQQVFPDPLCRPHKSRGWSSDGLYFRGTPMGDKDPAYKAVGWGMTIMGARANGIILDDVLDQKTAESPSEQEKARSYYDKTIVPRLNTQTGWLLAVMTRYAEGDLGGHFLKLAEQSGDWVVIRTPLEAEEADPLGRSLGESIWPEQFPPEFIAATRKRMSIAEYDLVYNCLDYSSPIRLTSPITRMYRRWYEGPHIKIVTASGKELSGTPNHPVLTSQGWVPLGQLTEGGDVLCSPSVDVPGLCCQDVDDSYPSIGQIYEAAAVQRAVKLGTPGQVHFHGDLGLGKPEVDVVDVDSLLMRHLVTQFPQITGQSLLGFSDADLLDLARSSPSQSLNPRLSPAIDLPMRRAHPAHVGVWPFVHDAPEGGVAVVADRNTEFLQLEGDRDRADVVAPSNAEGAFSGLITTDKIVQVVVDTAWSGHVYNLETQDHRFIADGVITHNCNPASMGGDIFTNESYFKDLPENFWSEIEPTCFIGQSVDLAFSAAKTSAWTVILTYAVDPNYRMYVLHVDRAHYQIRESENRLKDLIRWTKPLLTVIETENYHDQLIRGMVARIVNEVMANIRLEKAEGDKITRARLPAGRAEHGLVYVDRSAPWYRTFMTEILGFPRSRYRDQVDALSLACLTVQKMEEYARTYRPTEKRPQVEYVMGAV
jgi:predicted phage terminase large subunit-like protein